MSLYGESRRVLVTAIARAAPPPPDRGPAVEPPEPARRPEPVARP